MGSQTDQGTAHGGRRVFKRKEGEVMRVGRNTPSKEKFFGGDTTEPPQLPHFHKM